MKKPFALLPLLLVSLASPRAAQSTIQSTFDADVDGWTHTGAASFVHGPGGGNPGGYLHVDNSEGPITYVFAPAEFRGDLRPYDGGTLSFDGNMLGIGGTPWTSAGADYGHLRITSPAGVRTVDLVPAPGQPVNGTWTTYSVTLDVATFGGTQATWTAILANVTEVRLSLEAMFGAEVQGVDNVTLSAKPTAASSRVCNGTGVNPVILSNTSAGAPAPAPPYDAPHIGKNWRVQLDCNPNGTIGALAVIRVAFGPPPPPLATPFGEVLVGGPGSNVLRFALPADRIARFGPVLVPSQSVLIGSTYTVQGACPGSPPFLSNALCEVVGD